MTGIVCFFLVLCSVSDIRKKEIPLSVVITAFVLAAGFTVWEIGKGERSLAEAGISQLPGLFFLIMAFCTKEKVGYGDGMLLLISGLCLGFYQCFFGLCIALLCSSVTSIILLALHRADRDSGIAFAPFLAIGTGVLFFV